ncbi:MAG: hypothetical protein ACKOC5_12820, partial [Chloroflexota bacterium]
ADERLPAALDALLTGGPPDNQRPVDRRPVNRALEQLLGWGSSSGRAALHGMAYALRQIILPEE